MTQDRRQRTEDRRQRTGDRRQTFDFRLLSSACRLRGLVTTLLILVAPVLTCPLRAYEPRLSDGLGEPFDYFHNSWTVIGLKDYAHGTRITPDNQLIIHDSNGKPSRVLIRFGQQLTSLTRRQVKILMDGWLPVVSITAEDGQVMYEFTLGDTTTLRESLAKSIRLAYRWRELPELDLS